MEMHRISGILKIVSDQLGRTNSTCYLIIRGTVVLPPDFEVLLTNVDQEAQHEAGGLCATATRSLGRYGT